MTTEVPSITHAAKLRQQRVALVLPADIIHALDVMAARRYQSRSSLIRQVLASATQQHAPALDPATPDAYGAPPGSQLGTKR